MTEHLLTALWEGLVFLVHLAFVGRAILRPHREAASRVTWVVVILVVPVAGIVAYILLGETNIGRRRVARMREVLAQLPDAAQTTPGAKSANLQPDIPDRYLPLFRVGHSVNGFEPVGGNRARLLPDSNAAIESLVTDIDAAQEHVHLTFSGNGRHGGRVADDSPSVEQHDRDAGTGVMNAHRDTQQLVLPKPIQGWTGRSGPDVVIFHPGCAVRAKFGG